MPVPHVLLSLCSEKCACAVLAGHQSRHSVLKRPLSGTPLKLREVLRTSTSLEVRAGLDETLLYPVVASSLIIHPEPLSGWRWSGSKEGTYSAVHTGTHPARGAHGLH